MNKKKKSGILEAQATVRKDKSGSYYDISKDVLTRKGVKRLDDDQMMDLFGKLRLRYSLTPQCNIWCVFCSNEGLSYSAKKLKPSNPELITRLGDMLLENTPLKSIDFSGGEPTIHPDFMNKNYTIVDWTKNHPDTRFSLHTNGIELNSDLIDRIGDNFSRIGVSINAVNYDSWRRMSNMNDTFPQAAQAKKFSKIMDNLEYLASKNIGEKVFMKAVIMKGYNDSEKDLTAFLEKCAEYKFHPKFLQFEPQYPSQKKFEVGRGELFSKLERLGCEFPADAPRDNDACSYVPGVNFEYTENPGAQTGLHSIFGCGDEAVCTSCYDFLCMFVKPTDDGEGLYLKPCSVLDTRFDITHAVKTGNVDHLIDIFKMSREYLMTAPGIGISGWNKEEKYDR